MRSRRVCDQREAEEERKREEEREKGTENAEEKVIILFDPGLIHFAVDIIVIVRRQARWISVRSQQEVRDLLRSNLTVLSARERRLHIIITAISTSARYGRSLARSLTRTSRTCSTCLAHHQLCIGCITRVTIIIAIACTIINIIITA